MTSEVLPLDLPIRRFAPGVEDRVRVHFPDVVLTIIPARETPRSLEQAGIVEFDYPKTLNTKRGRIRFRLATHTQAIYVPEVLSGSFAEAFDGEEEDHLRTLRMIDPASDRSNAQLKVNSLPKVAGVRWVIPSRAVVARIAVNHLQEREEKILEKDDVWTSDQMESYRDNHPHLVVGHFNGNRLLVDYLPGGLGGKAGILAVGVPDRQSSRLHLVQR